MEKYWSHLLYWINSGHYAYVSYKGLTLEETLLDWLMKTQRKQDIHDKVKI